MIDTKTNNNTAPDAEIFVQAKKSRALLNSQVAYNNPIDNIKTIPQLPWFF